MLFPKTHEQILSERGPADMDPTALSVRKPPLLLLLCSCSSVKHLNKEGLAGRNDTCIAKPFAGATPGALAVSLLARPIFFLP